ncbi:hypothetical protein [Georgenia sp. Z1491]|uniref:hypothetical protein n=1 Tax=Georgenia sp. Z1491 TaxID=3416707 RepID=UPI003CF9646A
MTTRRARREAERELERAREADGTPAPGGPGDGTAPPRRRRRDRRAEGPAETSDAAGGAVDASGQVPGGPTSTAPSGPRTRRLDRSVATNHHLLVLERHTSASALAGVLVERLPDLRTRRDDEIILGPGAVLTGPWEVTPELAADLDLPGACAFVLRVRPDRGEPAPPELRGLAPLEDAFPDGTPQGDELRALENVQALARRLGGAVRVTGTGAVVVPDPASVVDRLVRSEVELGATELAVLLDRFLDDVVILSDDIWGGGSSSVGGRMVGDGPEWARDMVTIEVTTVAPVVELPAIRPRATTGGDGALPVPPLEPPVLGQGGAGRGSLAEHSDDATPDAVPGSRPVLTYEVRFRPGRPYEVLGTHPTRAGRRSRREGRRVVDGVAADLVRLIGGHVVDDDGFVRSTDGAESGD